MCGLQINIPGRYSLISLPKQHYSFPTSVFQVSHVSPFWVITLPTAAGSFGKTDNVGSDPCGSDHRAIVVHVACGLLIAQGTPLPAINHFCVSTLQQTAVLRLKCAVFQDR